MRWSCIDSTAPGSDASALAQAYPDRRPRLVRLVRHDRIRSIIRSIEGAGPVVARPADPPNGALGEAPLVGLFQLTMPARALAQNWS